VFKKHLSNICKIKVANNWIQNEQILGEFKNSKIAPRKIVAKNSGNILSQLLEKKAWSLGQWRQARGYGAVDQGVMLFFSIGSRHTDQFLPPWTKALCIS
jgi:hypothetical protein